MPKVTELKGTEVEEGAGPPPESLNSQIPITGNNLVSVGCEFSSRAVTAIEAVRLICAVN